MTTDKLLKSVLKQIKPDQESIQKTVNLFLKKVNAEIKKQKIDAVAVVGGSIAKDTNLKGDHDCDMFVKFNIKYKDKDLSKLLKKILKPFDPELVHGSRDYFQINKKINYEIVPVLDIKDPKEAVNVTDMSPLHVGWVKKNSKFADDIRLAKQFCKSVGVYGAESYIKGFSGHVLDITTIHYKGFLNLLKAASKWKYKEVIDPENHFKGKALSKLNRSKIDSAIIVIDPVLPDRNAAAALSEEKFKKFQKAAKNFLKDPKNDFFKIEEITKEKIITSLRTNLIILNAKPLDGKTDIVGAKLLKAFTYITNQLNFYDFGVTDADWYWNKKDSALLWYRVRRTKLVPLTKHVGPPTKVKSNADMFKKKHKKSFVEKGRICAYIPRKYTDVANLIDDLIKDKGLFKDKTKKLSVELLPESKKVKKK